MTGRSMLRRTTFVLIGGAILIANATLVIGIVSAATPQGPPDKWLLLTFTALAVALVGLLPGLRELQVAAAQTMLGADGVVVPTPMRWEHRWRTVLWCVLHQVVGFLVGLAFVLAAIGVTALVALAVGSQPQLDPGPPRPDSAVGWLLLGLATVGGIAAAALGAWFAGVAARWAAPLLLGPLGTDRLAVAEARLRQELEYRRLSRDLHDGVGHALSAISLQAEAGRRQLSRDPQRADESMSAIAALASAAVEELDHALGVLRDGLAPRSPEPGLTELADLVAAHRSLGMSVDASTGEVGEVPALVSHTAYRVCAEGLTNAAKHGVAGPVVLTVDRSLGGLRLEVRNPIDGATAAAGPGAGWTGSASRWRSWTVSWSPSRPTPSGCSRPDCRWESTMPERLRVLLADDEPLVRHGLRGILEAEPDIEVVGEAADGAAAVSQARSLRPDLVCMDIQMPGVDGLRATSLVLALPTPPKVLVLTTFGSDENVFAALAAGASAFLLKRASGDEIAAAVRAVAAGDSLLFPEAVRSLAAAHVQVSSYGGPALTAREAEVLGLVAQGLSNAEIATTLVLGVETVRTHVARLLAKLGARDRTQAVVLAYQTGLVPLAR